MDIKKGEVFERKKPVFTAFRMYCEVAVRYLDLGVKLKPLSENLQF